MAGNGIALDELARLVEGTVVGDGNTRIRDVTHDSRAAGPTDLFVAIPGAVRDGHDFLESTTAGAACVERPAAIDLPQMVVADTRAVLPRLAAEVHGHPSRRLTVVGVTGTNGKTTVTQMLASIVAASGGVPGVVGTVGARIGDEHVELARTSPEASDLQRLLARMVEGHVTVAAVEVSSHALALGRTATTQFRVVAFTNLSQDHLDFHGDMKSYFLTKAALFAGDEGSAVIAIDDEWGRRLVDLTRLPVTTVGTGGDVRAESVQLALTGSSFRMVTPWGEHDVTLALGGIFNVQNALVAAACALELGLALDTVAAGLSGLGPIPGRMEAVPPGDRAAVIVDYAHTPDGIEQVLGSTQPLVEGRTVVVVGAGGDRDRAKRADMGRAAGAADVAIITSDNPRSEPPEEIIAAVVAGAGGGARVIVEPDRARAIWQAVEMTGPGDAVLILGKGHETGQEIDGRILPFDDRLVARQAVDAS